MIKYLPVLFPTNKWYGTESLKGIKLRFMNSNSTELKNIVLTLSPVVNISNDIISQIPKSHIGIGSFGSKGTSSINIPADFLLFSPVVSADLNKDNNFIFILSEWEVKAIKKNLEYSGIDDSVLLITDLSTDTPYIDNFKEITIENLNLNIQSGLIRLLEIKTLRGIQNELKKLLQEDNLSDFQGELKRLQKIKILSNMKNEFNKLLSQEERKLSQYNVYLVVGVSKWQILHKLRNLLPDIGKKIIITTSSFEDHQVPAIIRKKFAKDVIYTYPKLIENTKSVINIFEKEFGYKPSICSLLAYDATDIVIKTLMEAGPGYKPMKNYLVHNQFDTITLGKIGFNDKGVAYLVGRSAKELFGVKYIDEKGNYKNE